MGMNHGQETEAQTENFLEKWADASPRGKMRDN